MSKQFYFTSDILTPTGTATYTYNNWGGVSVYEIEFELYSYNNKIEKLLLKKKYIFDIRDYSYEQNAIFYKAEKELLKNYLLV